MMYPKFIEVHNVNSGKPVSINVIAITNFFRYEDGESEETNIELNTCQYVNTKETYEEVKALIKDSGCLIHKADPRLDMERPLTMDDLMTMVGEPVWNSNNGKWGLVKEVSEWKGEIQEEYYLRYADDTITRFDEEDLKKYPMYRMRK